MWMSEYEIRKSYESAKFKKAQIKILAQLNETDEYEICRILGIGAQKIRYKKPNGKQIHKIWSKQDDERVIAMYNDGCPVKEIAAEIGRTLHAVTKRIMMMRSMGLIGKRRE